MIPNSSLIDPLTAKTSTTARLPAAIPGPRPMVLLAGGLQRGYNLPPGTEVIYSPYVTHRMPEIYPQPRQFLPGRWARLRPSAYEYLPFGAGPRRCLGAQLAMNQMKAVLAMLLQRYRLQLVPGARVDRLIRMVLMPKGGMPMIVWNQDRRFGQNKTEVRGNVREMVDLN